MTKELQSVTRQQAKRLCNAGFDLGCEYSYIEAARVYTGKCTNSEHKQGGYISRYTAPTVALALEWIRDNYSNEGDVKKGNIIFIIKAVFGSDGVFYVPFIYMFKKGKRYDVAPPDFPHEVFGFHRKYEAAESTLLDELLTILENEKWIV
jgi:hypothetical protein